MKRAFLSAMFSVAALSGFTWAQTPGGNLDQRGSQVFSDDNLTLVQRTALSPSTGTTGGDDLILLDEVPIFVVRAGASAGYTTNAFLSGNEDKADYLLSMQVQAGIETTIAESFDVRLLGNIGSVRYRRFQELDFDQLGGVLEVAKSFEPARFGLRYQPTSFHTTILGEQQLMLHPFTLFAQKDMKLPWGWQGNFEAGLQRTWANPSDYDAWSVYLDSRAIRPLGRSLFLAAGVELRYTRYDDFFESATNTDRQDFLIRPAVQLLWQPKPWIVATFELAGARNFSELGAVDYSAFTLTPAVNVQFRF